MIVNLVLPPAVIVHGADDVRIAIGAQRPLTLLSAPGAASYGGARWWRLVVAAAPGPVAADMLDCGDQAGHAVDALREGCRIVILDPASRAFADVAARAAELGAQLRALPPPALDLGRRGAARRLAAWLDGAGSIG